MYFLKYLVWLTLSKWSESSNNLNYSHFHNILRLFDVLTNFPFTTSSKHGIYELPHKLPNNLWNISEKSENSQSFIEW